MKIRSYNQTIIDECNNWYFNTDDRRAQVYSPTGGGKTVCFTALIKDILAISPTANILIVHPRLALSTDQQTRLKKDLSEIEIEFTSLHSGTVVNTNGCRNNKVVNTVEKLNNIRNTSTVPHITYTSYKSFRKVVKEDFDLIICDEAHTLIENEFRKLVAKIKSRVLFFTATPAGINDSEYDMANTSLFGKVIAKITPKELMTHGYLVTPRLRFVDITINEEKEEWFVQPTETIGYVFDDQRAQINPKLKHKMLVAMPNTQMFEYIEGELSLLRTVTNSEVDLYTVTAGTHRKNGCDFDGRAKLLEDFDNNKNECIIIHCDTLAEGIDIDSITGVFIFRNLSKRKFGQTIGRAGRPHKLDLDGDKEIIDLAKRIKPNSIITIPTVNGKLYCNDVNEFMNAFTLYGYDEIAEYIDDEFKIRGPKNDEESDAKDYIFSNIIDVRVHECVLEINELLFNRFFGNEK